MRIVQVATSYSERCGVGNFARNLSRALREAGAAVRTVEHARDGVPDADLTLIQHEWGLFDGDAAVREVAAASRQPVALVAHSAGGVERFADVAAAFVAMNGAVVGATDRPVYVFRHPAWIPAALADPAGLRARYGIPAGRYVIGSSGFLLYDRDFSAVIQRLLPHADAHDWHVSLASSTWRWTMPGIVEALADLARRHPGRLTFTERFLDANELHERLRLCDLLWCWTHTRSEPYASGSVSDQYGSGTRLVVSDKLQHEHVLALPNVRRASADLDEFVEQLVDEARTGVRTKHDPSILSWAAQAAPLVEFLRHVAARDRAAR